jgi:hypothetical protein
MSKTLFDHINQIYVKQDIGYFDNLEEEDRKTYSIYMINRFISMNMDYLPVVNEIQQYWCQIGPRESYLYYSQCLPSKKQFNKYIKGSQEDSFEKWVVEIVAKHFDVSKADAIDYLLIYYSSREGKEQLRSLLEGYGIDSKRLRKAKV